jgi:hypothetical protein
MAFDSSRSAFRGTVLRRGYGLATRLSHGLRQGASFNELQARNAECIHGISRARSHHAPVRPFRGDEGKDWVGRKVSPSENGLAGKWTSSASHDLGSIDTIHYMMLHAKRGLHCRRTSIELFRKPEGKREWSRFSCSRVVTFSKVHIIHGLETRRSPVPCASQSMKSSRALQQSFHQRGSHEV